jgi:Citrate synthase, C-terminal domain
MELGAEENTTRRGACRASRTRLQPLITEWLLDLRVLGRSSRTLGWYSQKMRWYLEEGGGVQTLEEFTAFEHRARHATPRKTHQFLELGLRQIHEHALNASAGVLQAIGLPTDMFPSAFAVARAAGWTAHVLGQVGNNRLIRPQSEYVGPEPRKPVPLGES